MSESITYSQGDLTVPPTLRLLHYNDVYHVDPSSAEPVGGIARFQTVCKYYREDEKFRGQPDLITLFSGDAFNPSLESTITRGAHMVPVLNQLGTDVACVGNHDLDFGVGQFSNLASQCSFPWLLANVIDPALGEDVPLGNAKKTVILTASNGVKVGVIGLAEREWLETINSLPPNLIYKSASATAEELVPGLREQGAEMIIALTHQREPNDNKLAEKTADGGLIDIILGGHDHFYSHSLIKGRTHVLRSGTDFKQLSYIEARPRKSEKEAANSPKWDFHIVRRDITSNVPADPSMQALNEKLTAALRSKLDKPLGYTVAPLDARFTTVRVRESNLGNFVCDLMRLHYYNYKSDCALIASGTIRGDQIYPPGVIRVKDILDCFPFEDPCAVLRISGQALYEALENSVSAYPALEGRFPQVSNITFEFDPAKPSGSRINWVTVGGKPLEKQQSYILVTRGYMARGKDGFDSLLARSEGGTAEELVSEESGILISTLLRQYFISLRVLGRWRHWDDHLNKHFQTVHRSLHDLHPVVEPISAAGVSTGNSVQNNDDDNDDDDDDDDDDDQTAKNNRDRDRQVQLARAVVRKWWRLAGLKGSPSCCDGQDEAEFQVDWTKAISPRVQGRIRMVGQNSALEGVGKAAS